jgi:tripartite-type tricarboxylate transporter receptor subunit TctC
MTGASAMMSLSIRAVIGVLALLLFPQFAHSDEWPAKPIKIIVPYGTGNGIDILSRMIAGRLSQRLGKTAFVENVPGVAAMLGAETVAKAEPDGYTFLSTANPPLTTNIYLFKSLPYDPYKAFDVVGMIADRGPFVIAVNKDVPVNSLEQLIDYAKARPGQVRYAIDVSSAYQSAIGKWLNKQAGIELVEIRYRAPAQAFQDVISGVAASTSKDSCFWPPLRDFQIKFANACETNSA